MEKWRRYLVLIVDTYILKKSMSVDVNGRCRRHDSPTVREIERIDHVDHMIHMAAEGDGTWNN